jgi:hypothetical protein
MRAERHGFEMSSAPPDDREPHTAMQGSTAAPAQTRLDRVARRAHEIYEARGGQHGKALEDWLQAEREIDGSI